MPKRTTDCKERIAERYDASLKRDQSVPLYYAKVVLYSYLAMRKSVEDSTVLNVLTFHHNFSVAPS